MIRGRCRRRTGIGWRTAVSNATCARAPAGCTRASGGCASCGAGRTADQVVLTSYGRSSGFCVDPVEKKPLNHFLPGTPVLSFGTAGCNLACRFCQNWDISKSREVDTLAAAASPEALADTARSLGCRSVAFTYNDPTIFLEYPGALHRVPSGLQDARRAADATGHPGPGTADRPGRRAAVRVHRQRPR